MGLDGAFDGLGDCCGLYDVQILVVAGQRTEDVEARIGWLQTIVTVGIVVGLIIASGSEISPIELGQFAGTIMAVAAALAWRPSRWRPAPGDGS